MSDTLKCFVKGCESKGAGGVCAPCFNDALARAEKLAAALREALTALPDTGAHRDDESWKWCWNELSGDAQDEVKRVRDIAARALAEINNNEGGQK